MRVASGAPRAHVAAARTFHSFHVQIPQRQRECRKGASMDDLRRTRNEERGSVFEITMATSSFLVPRSSRSRRGLLLSQTVECAESPDEIHRVDADDVAIGEAVGEDV